MTTCVCCARRIGRLRDRGRFAQRNCVRRRVSLNHRKIAPATPRFDADTRKLKGNFSYPVVPEFGSP